MSRIAFVFPGQGSQVVGMGKDLYDKYDLAKDLYSLADEIMEMPLSKISFEGPTELLMQTHITQPALFVHSYILTQLIGNKIKAEVTAGHSLGEYTSAVYSNSIGFEEGLRLVKTRGMLMKESGVRRPGTMAAIIGLSEQQINEVCDKAGEHQIVEPANYNAPGQIVISGDIEAVHRAMKIAKEDPYNSKLVKELQVSGAFHSQLMLASAEDLRKTIDKMDFKNSDIPIYTNVEASPVQNNEIIKNSLYRQLFTNVKWQQLIQNMINDFGITDFYEIGSGKVLTGMIKRIDPKADLHNIGTAEDLVNNNI